MYRTFERWKQDRTTSFLSQYLTKRKIICPLCGCDVIVPHEQKIIDDCFQLTFKCSNKDCNCALISLMFKIVQKPINGAFAVCPDYCGSTNVSRTGLSTYWINNKPPRVEVTYECHQCHHEFILRGVFNRAYMMTADGEFKALGGIDEGV